MSENLPVIAIDGPSGSGKGTVSRAVADALGWHFLDSGALYRLVVLVCDRQGLDTDGTRRPIARAARGMQVCFGAAVSGDPAVYLDGEDVTALIRTEECGARASRVAAYPSVRTTLIGLQRSFARPPGLVADGRDMGSTVFPTAGLKVFLTAGAKERARRRHKQLKQKGINVSLPTLSDDIAARDRRDATRTVAPLKPCPDARVLDSTTLGVEQVVARILHWAGEAFG